MLFAGDDWAEDHHDVGRQDEQGRVPARARLPEGIAGVTRLHALIGQFAGPDTGPAQVAAGIETGRGLRVTALRAAGYAVCAISPRRVSRYRERRGTCGARSDKAGAHTLAGVVRTGCRQLRAVAGDSAGAEAIKVAARARQALIWERAGHLQRLRAALREYFPAAPAPSRTRTPRTRSSRWPRHRTRHRRPGWAPARSTGALTRARRGIPAKAAAIRAALQAGQLRQPQPAAGACAATACSLTVVIAARAARSPPRNGR